MTGFKYYERIKLLLELLEKEKTGAPENLARKLGISVRTLYRIIEELNTNNSFIIQYCSEKKSYIIVRNNNSTIA
ncbi:MAG: HTH domain-containing protein [Chitinophagales bacterium]|nr:HTH domain-containing protein [Chitinophagales bacterium]